MTQTLPTSAISYCQAFKFDELDAIQRDSLPISSYKLPDGSYQVISYYRDDIWIFEDSRFPTLIVNNKKKIDFNKIPQQFIEPLKYVFKKYDIKISPAGGTHMNYYRDISHFLYYLNRIGIQCLSKITPLICANYVHESKTLISNQTKKPLGKGSLTRRFSSIEWLNEYCENTPWSFIYPWIDSSACSLAGNTNAGKRIAKTKVIPDEKLRRLVQYCQSVLDDAPQLIELKQKIDEERIRLSEHCKNESNISTAIRKKIVAPKGYSTLTEFNDKYYEILTASAIIILTFSGIRIHELAAIQCDAYRVQDDEETISYYLKSHSSKTYEGNTEWLVPEIVIDAIKIQQLASNVLRAELLKEQQALLSKDDHDPRGLRINQFKNNLFLINNNKINPLSDVSFNFRLKKLGEKFGITGLAPHQFRRTFAIYVAKSIYGDLRYLRDHFKHWSMDMTLLYADHESVDDELCNDIANQIQEYKIDIAEEFLSDDTIISGGLADKIIEYRTNKEEVKIFNSRREMAEKLTDTIHIRATGHSWCTADGGECIRPYNLHGTNCANCSESIIEKKRHSRYWKAVYLHQLELRKLDDIGPSGQYRVEKDIARCEEVLTQLGIFDEVRLEADGSR
jgi:integrase